MRELELQREVKEMLRRQSVMLRINIKVPAITPNSTKMVANWLCVSLTNREGLDLAADVIAEYANPGPDPKNGESAEASNASLARPTREASLSSSVSRADNGLISS